MTLICTIHQVRFGSEPLPGCKAQHQEQAKLPTCPVCNQNELETLRTELRRLTQQNHALIEAIELKQKHLALVQP